MLGREDRIYEEAAALWRAVRGSAPPRDCDAGELILRVLQDMDLHDYERLGEADRRSKQIAWPVSNAAG